MVSLGKTRQQHEHLRIQHLQQGLNGAKDIKLLGREHDFSSQYDVHNFGYAAVNQKHKTLLEIPRLWIELLIVGAMVSLVLVMLAEHKPFEQIMPLLGLFSAAVFRMMPSFNRILLGMQNLSYALPTINNLSDEFHSLKQAPTPTFKNPCVSGCGTMMLEL